MLVPNGSPERPAVGSRTKIAVVGAGPSGGRIAFALARAGLPVELVLVDVDRRREGGAPGWDLGPAAGLVKPITIRVGGLGECAGAAVVFFTAGLNGQPGQPCPEVDPTALARHNLGLLRRIFPRLIRLCRDAIWIMLTEPVDIVTYAATLMVRGREERVMGLAGADVGHAASRLAAAILRDEGSVHVVSALAKDVPGLPGRHCLALPRTVGAGGLRQWSPETASAADLAALREPADRFEALRRRLRLP